MAVAACGTKSATAPAAIASSNGAPGSASSDADSTPRAGDLVATCDEWLRKVQAGDADGSYAMLSETLRSNLGPTDWAASMKVEQESIVNRKLTSASGNECDYSIEGTKDTMTIVFTAENGTLHVDLYSYQGGG